MKKELKYAKMLESAGLSREQAEIHLRVIEDAMTDNVATKFDLQETRSELKSELQEVRSELKAEIQEVRSDLDGVRSELKNDLHLLEQRLINKMGFMLITTVVTTVSLLGGLITLFEFVI